MPRTALALAAALVALPGAGCALTAKRPPTPAAAINSQDLARVPPPPGERYYLMVFGSETVPPLPRYTHSWATVVRAVGDTDPVLECHTISWMPATLDIHPWRFRVEPGVNLSLEQSLKNAVDTRQRIAMWGPYEVWHGFYTRFTTQEAFLRSGRIGYQCIDSVGEAARAGDGSDCIHAISDMDPVYSRARYPLLYFGVPASRNLVRRIMRAPVVIDPPATHDWLIPRLGLDRYPVVRREYHGPAEPYVSELPRAGLDVPPAPRVPLPLPVPRPRVEPKTAPPAAPTAKETPPAP